MIDQILTNVIPMIVAVSLGTYIGSKIMKRELKKEISRYLANEIPHLLENEEFKKKGRELLRVFVKELITVISEELGLKRVTEE
ncbi:MAG: hypothetical protein KIH10_17735 [Candidatus Freyarchaeota archaeon]|nr:hypothetical protein [Candidatus Jordarchaeia archaeon]